MLKKLFIKFILGIILIYNYQLVFARDYYGAIAHEAKTDTNGISWNKQTASAAKKQALAVCSYIVKKNHFNNVDSYTYNYHKYKCRIVVVVKNECGALSAPPLKSKESWGVGKSTKINSARKRALKQCLKRNKYCYARTAVCAGTDYSGWTMD